jgi:hypothetical protein
MKNVIWYITFPNSICAKVEGLKNVIPVIHNGEKNILIADVIYVAIFSHNLCYLSNADDGSERIRRDGALLCSHCRRDLIHIQEQITDSKTMVLLIITFWKSSRCNLGF